MDREDHDYLESRAEAEIKLAQEAEHPAAVRAHYLLAGLYLDKVHGDDERQAPDTAEIRRAE